MNKLYSLDTRKKVLEMYRDGIPMDEIIQRNNISRGRMYAWVREANLPHRRKNSACSEIKPFSSVADPSTMSLTERKALIDQFRIRKIKLPLLQNIISPAVHYITGAIVTISFRITKEKQ